MKKTSIITAAVLAASFGLVGCGGGGGGSSSGSVSTTTVQGTAVDPELIGATVCFDIDSSGVCEVNEPSVKTNMDGTYSLTIPTDDMVEGATLLVQGGYDRVTKMPFVGTMTAMIDDSISLSAQMITPLTTLVYERAMAVPESMEEAQAEVANLLALTYDEVQANMLTLTNKAALQAALAMQQAAELAAEANDTRAFYRAMAEESWTQGNDNLTDLMIYVADNKPGLDDAKKLQVEYFSKAMDSMNAFWAGISTEFNVMSVEKMQEQIINGKTNIQIMLTMAQDMISTPEEMESFVTEHLLKAAGIAQPIINQVKQTIVDNVEITVDTGFGMMVDIMENAETKADLIAILGEAQYNEMITKLEEMQAAFEPAI
jgi:hypothetical protein